MKKIIKNAIRCKKCGEVIESKNVHDMVFCKCGCCSVDGGTLYLRRSFTTSAEEDFEELSEYEEVKDKVVQKDT